MSDAADPKEPRTGDTEVLFVCVSEIMMNYQNVESRGWIN